MTATTTRGDLGRVALGAPALKEVFIVSVPDCLLIKSWARSGRANAEEAAVLLGECFKAGMMALANTAPNDTASAVTVEAKSALVRLERVSDELVAGFVFDRSAPMGLVHVQARQLKDHIQNSLEQFSRPDMPVQSLTPKPAPAPPPKLEAPETPFSSEYTPVHGIIEKVESTGRFPAPIVDVVTKPMARPRAVRLLDFFRRYAPDAHASLLRLSLKTGIPVEQLELPETLGEDQVDKIATAVRDILGQDNVGL